MVSRIETLIQPHLGSLAAIAMVLCLLFLLLFVRQIRLHKRHQTQLDHARRLLRHIQPATGLENNLNVILEMITAIVEAQDYAFYLLDDRGAFYLLKALRHRQDSSGPIAPSYSGLAPFRKEVYQPPMSLPATVATREIALIQEGEVPLLTIPLHGGKGMVRIGPLFKLPKQTRDLLENVADLLPQLLDVLIETDKLKMQTDVVLTSEAALNNVCSMALDADAVLRKTLGMFSTSLGIEDVLVVVQQEGRYQVPVMLGWSRETERLLAGDRELTSQLWSALGHREVVSLRKGSHPYAKIDSQLLGPTGDRLLACKFIADRKSALLVCRVGRSTELELSESQLTTSMTTLAQQLSRLMRIQNGIKPLSHSYVELLKLLCKTIDDLNPYTVGYSELMSRYAVIIAQEMGLSQKETEDIALAAYLSNIGVLGLSEELYLKEGKFSEIEYEKMKLHAEVGAVIVEMTVGNKDVANIIRHHHERIDGNGYPAGLRGSEIPVGACILAVVQTFLAKINGRKYRAPLPFDKALSLLKSSAGAQLDQYAVDALIRWFQRKQNAMRGVDRPLGPCWEMCCTPSDICATCPAFRQPEINCWEAPNNNCQAHGKSCETCFVFTEAMVRRGQAVVVS